MNIHRFFAGATVAAVLTIATPALAGGLLGGNASGAVNGALSGRTGGIDGDIAGRATGSIDAQTDAVGRVGRRTRDIGERATDRVKDTAGAVRERTESTVDNARDTTVDASASAAATATTAVDSGAATASGAVDAAGSAKSGVQSTIGAAGSAASDVSVPKTPDLTSNSTSNSEASEPLLPSGDATASGDLTQAVGARKSVEAGDRTIDAMSESSAQGSARGTARSDEGSGMLDVSGNGSAQSATGVNVSRKPKVSETPSEPTTPPAPREAGNGHDRR